MTWLLFIVQLQILSSFISPTLAQSYLAIPPVKLLTVDSVANRFPAAGSVENGGYRTSIENGFDEDAQRSSIEELNDFPASRMILNPGGCGFYQLEVKYDEFNMFVQPAHKQGDYHEDFCNKAPVTVEVNPTDDTTTVKTFRCFESTGPDGQPVDPCSPSPCTNVISSLFPPEVKENMAIKVKVCSDDDSSHTAAMWELNFSRSNDSMEIEGIFPEPARDRISHVQDTQDFNTQLSIVSIVGKRGAGKSTVASFLSGNSSMFTTGDSSSGTTTEGADISTTLPSIEWANILGEKIQRTITAPSNNFPLFLVDSEGMGVRGDTFDFITTSPPAIIAKMVLYLSEGSLTTNDLLLAINDYMNGLDNIIIDNESTQKVGTEYCEKPSYGHFVSVINKMMGDDSDEQLEAELMDTEPEYTDDAKKRNEIRNKLKTCFEDGVTVHGLPYLTIPPDTPVDYPILDNRFRDGLSKMANSIVERLSTARIVTVAGEARELNATNAESIIGTVITEANNGKIDLGGFDTFWEYTKSDLKIFLRTRAEDLEPISPNCNQLSIETGYECTDCVCSYRNKMVSSAMNQVDQTLNMAKVQAMSMFGVDLDNYIPEFLEEVVSPWNSENTCSSGSASISSDAGICDSGTLNIGESAVIQCNMFFICKQITVNGNDVAITSENIWVGEGTSISNAAIRPGQNGQSGQADGESGTNGESGRNAPNLSISANSRIESSSTNIQFTSKGGDGGNGGNAREGHSNMDKIPAYPTASQVVNGGTYVEGSYKEVGTGSHCGGHCHTQDEFWYYNYPLKTTQACGGRGGNGGDGGNAGGAGLLTITGTSGVTANGQNLLPSKGGSAGLKGNGVYGQNFDMIFTAYHEKSEAPGCHGFLGTECGPTYTNSDGGLSHTGEPTDCPGNSGIDGTPGQDWSP